VRTARDAGRLLRNAAFAFLGAAALGCAATGSGGTPSIVAGSSSAPREVNLIARDYAFVPSQVELVPGETILLHVINGGLVVHEAIIGNVAVQEAWESAESAVAEAPPGPTPVVRVPPGLEGLRVVVASGERVDVTWTVPRDAGAPTGSARSQAGPAWFVGCHIAGHLANGMQVPIVWVAPQGDS
jgi:hypothetical protein